MSASYADFYGRSMEPRHLKLCPYVVTRHRNLNSWINLAESYWRCKLHGKNNFLFIYIYKSSGGLKVNKFT